MNENMTIFQSPEFGNIRTMRDEKGEALFCAKDVCDALGYQVARKAVRDHVEEGDVLKRNTPTTSGIQQMLFINESGLYSLILSSKLESARRFKHWVTSEVLPSIRKQGGYMVARADEPDEVIMARALQIMHATLLRRDEELALLRPKAEYTDRMLDAVSCFTTTQLAKGMGMTAIELNRLLCQRGIQYGQSGQYMLYAHYARMGLAQNRISSYPDMFGTLHTTSRLVWTEKGREFVYRLLNNKKQHKMKSIFKVIKQGEPQQVASQKAEGGQLNKCMITLQEWGDKYANTFVCTLLGNSALCRWSAGDIVLASLRFQAREYNGQWYQDITVNDILTAN